MSIVPFKCANCFSVVTLFALKQQLPLTTTEMTCQICDKHSSVVHGIVLCILSCIWASTISGLCSQHISPVIRNVYSEVYSEVTSV